MNEENVYIVTDGGMAARYNVGKDIWDTVIHDENDQMMLFDKAPKIWFDFHDRFTLYCAGDQDEVVFRWMDVRENKPKWYLIENNDVYLSLNFVFIA